MTCEYCFGQDIPGCKNCDPGWEEKENLKKNISTLTIADLFELIIKAIKECKRQDSAQSEAEYQKLTDVKVPQEY